MASLKDMRVRIAATKATQKITKAMQMVAASKLRRAQAAAEAARPFAERMEAVLRNIASGSAGSGTAPRLLAGTGNDKVHLLIVATGERGLAGAFNSSIVRLAREHINRLSSEGKEVKILTVGKKGYEQLRRNYEKNIVDRVELRGVRTLGYSNAAEIAEKVIGMFERGEFDVATLFYARFKSVIAQIPTAQQIVPPKFDAPAADRRRCGDLRIRARGRRNSRRTAAALCRDPDFPRAAREQRLVLRLADVGDGQRHPQCRRHDPQADHHL